MDGIGRGESGTETEGDLGNKADDYTDVGGRATQEKKPRSILSRDLWLIHGSTVKHSGSLAMLEMTEKCSR